MNKVLRRLIGLVSLFALAFLCYTLSAQTVDPVTPGIPAVNPLQSIFDTLVGKYTWVLTVLTVIGILRVVVKPVMLVIEAVVKATPSTSDDEAIAKFEAGPVMKWLLWGLDWLTSLKAPSAATTNPMIKLPVIFAIVGIGAMCLAGCSTSKQAAPADTYPPNTDAPCQGTGK